ncbi:unnamed protein product [Pleuronectes platessa]|uniref:Secreted protein n=1 Tax=Pleuronectes platessa TaxID=8262 RepID=A0A9N7YIA9_PLEPL|nr:unnamed protein product [Pleuronectes platessa]
MLRLLLLPLLLSLPLWFPRCCSFYKQRPLSAPGCKELTGANAARSPQANLAFGGKPKRWLCRCGASTLW